MWRTSPCLVAAPTGNCHPGRGTTAGGTVRRAPGCRSGPTGGDQHPVAGDASRAWRSRSDRGPVGRGRLTTNTLRPTGTITVLHRCLDQPTTGARRDGPAPRGAPRPDDSYLVVRRQGHGDVPTSPTSCRGTWVLAGDAFASGVRWVMTTRRWGSPQGCLGGVKRRSGAGRGHPEPRFTVVGVGDMCEMCVRQGMLLSEHIRLVAAFDIGTCSWTRIRCGGVVRRAARLFAAAFVVGRLDRALISTGGGVWSRTTKASGVRADARRARAGLEGPQADPT